MNSEYVGDLKKTPKPHALAALSEEAANFLIDLKIISKRAAIRYFHENPAPLDDYKLFHPCTEHTANEIKEWIKISQQTPNHSED